MAENSAEPTDTGQGLGSDSDTRQLSVESPKDAISESLLRFSGNLVSVSTLNLPKFMNSLQSNLLLDV